VRFAALYDDENDVDYVYAGIPMGLKGGDSSIFHYDNNRRRHS